MQWIVGNLELVGSLLILAVALCLGPVPLVVRGIIRKIAGRAYIRRWSVPATLGLSIGMLSFAIFIGLWNESRTINAALLCLLLLLAFIDLQWRWLPIEWTLSVIALGLLSGLLTQDFGQVLVQILVPSIAIFAVRLVVSTALKKEAMGLGDVWLIAGLGGFLPVVVTFLLVGFAAFSGLLELLVRRAFNRNEREMTSVSYGTHLCFVFLVLASFPQIIST